MSKRIDPNKPLTDYDREQLRLRGRHSEVRQIDAGTYAVTPVEVDPVSDRGSRDKGEWDREAAIERLRGMSSDELTSELEKRSLDASGRKSEKQQRLLDALEAENG